jgi:hypothetical protein
LRMSTSSLVNRVGSAHLTLGRHYTGAEVRRSSFSTDGHTVKGFVDRRATVQAPLGTDARGTRFADGQPLQPTPATQPPTTVRPTTQPPNQSTAPSTARPTTQPANQSTVPSGVSSTGRLGTDAVPQPEGQLGRRPPWTEAPPAPGEQSGLSGVQLAVNALLTHATTRLGACGPDPTASRETTRCTYCQLSCRDAWVRCSLQSVQSSLGAGPLAPVSYLGTATTTCDVALQQCFRSCKGSGACCPDHCQGDQTCCQTAWGCCPPSPHSTRTWSRSWPTCPRCGTPPWPVTRAVTGPHPSPPSPSSPPR